MGDMRRKAVRLTVLAIRAVASFAIASGAIATSAAAQDAVPGFPVTGSVQVEGVPGWVGNLTTVSPFTENLYVIGAGNSITRIDENSLTTLGRVNFEHAIDSIAAPTWSDVILVHSVSRSTVLFLDSRTLQVVRELPVGPALTVAVDRVNPRLFVSAVNAPIIRVVDARSAGVISEMPRLPGSFVSAANMWPSPDGRHLMWSVDDFLTVAEVETGKVVGRYQGLPTAAPSSDWSRVFAATRREPWKVEMLSFPELEPVGEIASSALNGRDRRNVIPGYRGGLLPTRDGKYLVSLAMTERGATNMMVFNLARPKAAVTSVLPIDVSALVQSPDGRNAWAVGSEDQVVLRLDLVPSRPGRVVAVGEGVPGGATVTWGSRVGAWVPGSARVTAVASPGGRSCSSEGSACTIAGLDRGKRYSIRVWAENVAGRGPVARTSVRVPDVKPPRLPAPQRPESKPGQEVS